MSKLICHQEKVNELIIEELIKVCPFNAIENKDGKVEINSGCKMCKLCVKNGPAGVMEFVGGLRFLKDCYS
jgi:electron transfer flavoprotein alpha subunit